MGYLGGGGLEGIEIQPRLKNVYCIGSGQGVKKIASWRWERHKEEKKKKRCARNHLKKKAKTRKRRGLSACRLSLLKPCSATPPLSAKKKKRRPVIPTTRADLENGPSQNPSPSDLTLSTPPHRPVLVSHLAFSFFHAFSSHSLLQFVVAYLLAWLQG